MGRCVNEKDLVKINRGTGPSFGSLRGPTASLWSVGGARVGSRETSNRGAVCGSHSWGTVPDARSTHRDPLGSGRVSHRVPHRLS